MQANRLGAADHLDEVPSVVACVMSVVGSLSDWPRQLLEFSYPATLWSLLLVCMKMQVRPAVGELERLKRLRGGVYASVLVCALVSI